MAVRKLAGLAVALVLVASGCGTPSGPASGTGSPTTVAPSGTATSTESPGIETSGPAATATNTEASPTPTPTPTPVPGLPEVNEAPPAGTRVEAGNWSIVLVPAQDETSPTSTPTPSESPATETPATETPAAQTAPEAPAPTPPSTVAVKINGAWNGRTGELAERRYSQAPNSQATFDPTTATPYFLSWSYVVTSGDPDAEPEALVMPSVTGTLFAVDSIINARECPDQQEETPRGIGFEVRRCVVLLSNDGGEPEGLAFAVPGPEQQYWYYSLPEMTPRPE